LISIAHETGGRAIYNTNDLRAGFADIMEENRGYYLLAYNPGAFVIAEHDRDFGRIANVVRWRSACFRDSESMMNGQMR